MEHRDEDEVTLPHLERYDCGRVETTIDAGLELPHRHAHGSQSTVVCFDACR